MAIRVAIPEREPLENVEIEYERAGASRKKRRPGFNRARLLDITDKSIEIAAREVFNENEKVTLTFHLKNISNYVKVNGLARKSMRVTVRKQPAFGIGIEFDKLSAAQVKKISWARDELAPRPAPARLKRAKESPKPESQKPAEPTPTPEERRGPEPTARVKRPVALLELIDKLDQFEVSEELILAIIEAAEEGLDVEVLYPKTPAPKEHGIEGLEAEEEAPEAVLPAEGEARPLNVYRLARNTRLHFADGGLPVGPATELLYLSRLKSPQNCFAVELDTDSMTQEGMRGFNRGSLLLFSTTEPVNSGDFAFVKSRNTDEFAQVFFDKNDEIRIHPLNSNYRERVARRSEVRLLCKLVGHYADWS